MGLSKFSNFCDLNAVMRVFLFKSKIKPFRFTRFRITRPSTYGHDLNEDAKINNVEDTSQVHTVD